MKCWQKLGVHVLWWVCTWLCGPAAAENRLVVRMEGKVESRRASEAGWRPIFSSRLLGQEDWTRTGFDSRAKVLLEGGSVVYLGANTQVLVGRVETAPGAETQLRQGVGIINVVKVRGGKPLQVRTPSATLSVRGTDFDCQVDAIAPLPDAAVLDGLQGPMRELHDGLAGIGSYGPIDWHEVLNSSVAAARTGGPAEAQKLLVDLGSAVQAGAPIAEGLSPVIQALLTRGSVAYRTRVGVREGSLECQGLDVDGSPIGPPFSCQEGFGALLEAGRPALPPFPEPGLAPPPLVEVSSYYASQDPGLGAYPLLNLLPNSCLTARLGTASGGSYFSTLKLPYCSSPGSSGSSGL